MKDSGIRYDKKWQSKYENMIQTSSEAIAQIRPGQRVFIATGCAQPQVLIKSLLDRANQLEGVEIVQLLTLIESEGVHNDLAKHFSINSFFISGNIGEGIPERLCDYTPIALSAIPKQFSSGRLPLDIALIQVTEPNEQGFCSLGISVDVTKSAAENATLVIAQVNPRMPWTTGASLLHVHDIDILVPSDVPLLEVRQPEPTETSVRIAENIAGLIDDGSTLEVGIKRIQIALLEFLKEKRDLGIHTEVLTDAIVDLMESGAVTGAHKSVDQGKAVTSLCMGSRKLYDYVDNNDDFLFRSSEYVSNPDIISRQKKMVTVNVGLEVDLSGQVSANSLESKYFSGLGGHSDFTHGVTGSEDGKLIVALDSTRKNGAISRIVPSLSGGDITVTCYEAQYIVTEYGVAYLHGKSLQERVMALISIAHPDFRAELFKEAINREFLHPDLASQEGKIIVSPQELKSSCILDNGLQVHFRPIHPTDEKRMHSLFHSLSKETLYYRFMSHMTQMPQRQIQNYVYTDYRTDMAIVGTIPESDGDKIIAVGRYYLYPTSNRAEVAFIVREEWQNQGIATFLLKFLITIAKRNGIAGFTAEVLRNNKPMMAVFDKSGCKINTTTEENVYSYELDFV